MNTCTCQEVDIEEYLEGKDYTEEHPRFSEDFWVIIAKFEDDQLCNNDHWW